MRNEPENRGRLAEQFRAPGARFRGKPLWSWNDRLDRDELVRQVRVLKEMGMGGFFMHSRTGLATEYLGREWFEAVEACACEAEKLGMKAWLYDEDRWPSGTAGGLVTGDQRFRMQYLRCLTLSQQEFRQVKKPAVAAFAAVVEGLDLVSYRIVPPDDSRILRPGEKVLLFAVELAPVHDFFNGGAYLNTLNAAAVRRFLSVTHERYRTAVGKKFGGVIPGIFTDEPHHGFVMCKTSPNWLYPPDSGWVTPWAGDFARSFQLRFGYDLRERLPELFLRLDGEKFSPVKWHYMEHLQSLFLERWTRALHDWCAQHDLQLTGHFLAEDLPGSQSVTTGSVMRHYEWMQTPGIDLLLRNNLSFWTAKQLASAGRQLGKPWLLSELYGCTGWQATFADHKEIGDWQAMLGINIRCHHLSWYSMAGERKRDFPASIFYQSAWHREYRLVEDYYARLHVILQRGKAVCDLLVIHPVESVWAQIHAGWAAPGALPKSPGARKVDGTFAKVFRWVMGAQLDFDYADEEQLSRLGAITRGNHGATLSLGAGAYRAVLVAGLETIRGSTLQLLEKFSSAGGKLIFAGPPPAHVDAVKSPAAVRISRQAVRVPLTRASLIRAVREAAPPRVELKHLEPLDEVRPVLIQTRRDGKSWIVAICNTDPLREHPAARVTFRHAGDHVVEWDCQTGKKYTVAHRQSKRGISWAAPLPVLGERIFRIMQKGSRVAPPRRELLPRSRHVLKGPFTYQLDEPNVLVVDRFEWSMGNGGWESAADILAIDIELRRRCGFAQRGLGMMQPWARKPPKRKTAPALRLRTELTVKILPEKPFELLIEQPHWWSITLNGTMLKSSEAPGWFIDPCFRKIPTPASCWRVGLNQLEFSARFSEELDLEAMYLLGSFGVFGWETGRPVLKRLPDTLQIGDVTKQGLPFYTGRVRYFLPLPERVRPTHLRLPAFGGAACSVRLPGRRRPLIIGFPPYETALPDSARNSPITCDVILTRRNIFGPLHLLPMEQNAILPSSFRSRGKHWAETPQLVPSGLLKEPELYSA